jgi:hypothetical protein
MIPDFKPLTKSDVAEINNLRHARSFMGRTVEHFCRARWHLFTFKQMRLTDLSGRL